MTSPKLTAATIGLALALPAAGSPAAAQAAFPGANGQVAFAAFNVRHTENAAVTASAGSIDVTSPGGDGRRSLRACIRVMGMPDRGDCSIQYGSPAWSPRGMSLAFDAGGRLATMRSDGSGLRVLRRRTADDDSPAWSPSGTRLAFTGNHARGGSDIYVLDLGTPRLTRLTFRGGYSPAWSSKGRIAFTRGGNISRPGSGNIYTVRPDGGGLRRITQLGGSDPSWSPYATKLAFARNRTPGASPTLYVTGADGRGLRRLTTPRLGSPPQPSWSPDGAEIAYTGADGGVWAQRLDGTGVRQIARGGTDSQFSIVANAPDWQPAARR